MIGTVSLEQIDDINRNATLGIFIEIKIIEIMDMEQKQ